MLELRGISDTREGRDGRRNACTTRLAGSHRRKRKQESGGARLHDEVDAQALRLDGVLHEDLLAVLDARGHLDLDLLAPDRRPEVERHRSSRASQGLLEVEPHAHARLHGARTHHCVRLRSLRRGRCVQLVGASSVDVRSRRRVQ